LGQALLVAQWQVCFPASHLAIGTTGSCLKRVRSRISLQCRTRSKTERACRIALLFGSCS
jgi:hypothetical protein